MTEMEPRGPQTNIQSDSRLDEQIDGLLSRSMAGPVPGLPPNFDQCLMGKVHLDSQPLDPYRQVLLTGYGATSVVASAVAMRGQGLNWGTIAGMILVPLALVAVLRSTWRVAPDKPAEQI